MRMVSEERQQRLEERLREEMVAVVGLSSTRTGYVYHGSDGYYMVTHDEGADEYEGPRRVAVWRRGQLFDEGVWLEELEDVPGPVAALVRAE